MSLSLSLFHSQLLSCSVLSYFFQFFLFFFFFFLSALGVSCQYGHLKIVRLLLQQPSIDVNKGAKGWSPLVLAKHNNHNEIIQLLKEAGAQ